MPANRTSRTHNNSRGRATVDDIAPSPRLLAGRLAERGEQHENMMRKDFSASERYEIGRAIAEAAGERRGRPNGDIVQDPAQLPKGTKTRDIAAEASGLGIRDDSQRVSAPRVWRLSAWLYRVNL